jgi:hypothetical protein
MADFAFDALESGSRSSVLGCTHTHNITSAILQLAESWCAGLQGFVGVVFLMQWMNDEDPLHKSPTSFKRKLDNIFCGQFYYHKVTE